METVAVRKLWVSPRVIDLEFLIKNLSIFGLVICGIADALRDFKVSKLLKLSGTVYMTLLFASTLSSLIFWLPLSTSTLSI